MAKQAWLMAGSMALALTLGAATFSEERAALQDTTPYTGPRRPFDPRALMEKLRADPSKQIGPFTLVCVSAREFGLKEFNEVGRQADKAGRGMNNIFVFQHLPLFSVGSHEDNPNHPMVDLCAKYDVTAVICGCEYVHPSGCG